MRGATCAPFVLPRRGTEAPRRPTNKTQLPFADVVGWMGEDTQADNRSTRNVSRKPKLVNPTTPTSGEGSPSGGDLGPSSDFMARDLARSGLEPKDLNVQPLPVHDGNGIPAYRIIYPQPGMYRDRFDGGDRKYKGPSGRSEIYFRQEHWSALQTQKFPLVVVEGEKKLECLIKFAHLVGVAIGGANNFRNSDCATLELLPDLDFLIRRLARYGVLLILDGDIADKREVAQAARWFAACCAKLGAACRIVQLPKAEGEGERLGLDDWIMRTGLRGAKLRNAIDELPSLEVSELPEPRRVAIERLDLDVTVDEEGRVKVRQTVENAVALVRDTIGERVATDALFGEVLDARPWVDNDRSRTRMLVEQLIGHSWPRELHAEACAIVMEDKTTNFVADWIKGLKWDRKKRLATLFVDHFGAGGGEQSPAYLADTARAFMCGAVKRMLQPGCHVEHMIILQGAQGIGKTRALQVLAGEFQDRRLLSTQSLGGKEDELLRVIEGSWFVSFDELAGHSKRDDAHLKNLLSQSEHVRNVKYLEKPRRHYRHCVFVATTNEDNPLRDMTGNRRYLVVKCGQIDVDALARIREQLIAEARDLVEKGDQFWVVRDAEEEQEKARARHPWEEVVANYLSSAELPKIQFVRKSGDTRMCRFTTAFAVAHALRAASTGDALPVERAAMIAGRIVSRLGWVRRQFRRNSIEWGQVDTATLFPAVPDGRGGNNVIVPERVWLLVSPD